MAKKEKKDHHNQPIEIEIELLPNSIISFSNSSDKLKNDALYDILKHVVDTKERVSVKEFLEMGESCAAPEGLETDLGFPDDGKLWCG